MTDTTAPAPGTPAVSTTIAEIRSIVRDARARGERVALVPTMGALHDGHLSLARAARGLADVVIVSIFVNPLQFGPNEDFDRYPRTLDADLAALGDLADHVFAPTVGEMYPNGPSQTRIAGGEIAGEFEGASRPGHFDGMLTVVNKLLNIVQPDAAMFGQKDAQQVFLVRQMVADLDIPVSIEAVPIVRETDGLARSSRNRYLDPDAREAAVTLSRALHDAVAAAPAGVQAALDAGLKRVRASAPVKLDYLAIVDPQTFRSVADGYRGAATVLIAARVGTTRLIDNASAVIG
ncbi:pantoate--beta-alanine ligase [Rathayibacter sp. CAU 1779]